MKNFYALSIEYGFMDFDKYIFPEDIAKELCSLFNLDLEKDFIKCRPINSYIEFFEFLKNRRHEYILRRFCEDDPYNKRYNGIRPIRGMKRPE